MSVYAYSLYGSSCLYYYCCRVGFLGSRSGCCRFYFSQTRSRSKGPVKSYGHGFGLGESGGLGLRVSRISLTLPHGGDPYHFYKTFFRRCARFALPD